MTWVDRLYFWLMIALLPILFVGIVYHLVVMVRSWW